MRKPILFAFVTLLISYNILYTVTAQPTYFVTVDAAAKPNRPHYRYREIVNVTGSFYFNGEPVEGALVAVEVKEIGGTLKVLRTAPTGNISEDWSLDIISIIPCDQNGKPKTNFYRNGDFFVNVTVQNKMIVDRSILLIAIAADVDSTPLGINWVKASVAANSVLGVIFNIWLPDWSSTGTGKVWVNLLTEWPENNGYPYCPERTANFNIISSTSSSSESSTTSQEGIQSPTEYRASFRLPPRAAPYNANFSVHVGAYYNGWTAFQSTTFQAKYKYPEDYDYNFEINIYDVVKVTSIYAKKSGQPGWNPQLDFLPDGRIGVNDVVLVTSKFAKKYTE
jgi:hypothetical protein